MKSTFLQQLICATFASGALLFSSASEAAVVTDKAPILTYADHTVPTYDKAGGKRVGFITPNISLVHIKSIRSDGWAYGSYAIAGGKRIERWFEMRELQGYANFQNYVLTIDADRTVYRTSAAAAKLGSVLLNAQATVIGEEGNYLKIIYRVNGGSEWKMGWIEREVVPYNGGEDIPQEIPTENENGGSTVNVHNEINIIIPNQNPTNPLEDKPIEEVGHDPQGEVEELKYDEKSKMLTVKGWAYDEDNLKSFVKVKVYVGGDRTTTSKAYEFYANLPRSDEKGNHGFLGKITLNLTDSQDVYVYALNLVGTQGTDQQIGNGAARCGSVLEGSAVAACILDDTVLACGWTSSPHIKVIVEDAMNAQNKMEYNSATNYSYNGTVPYEKWFSFKIKVPDDLRGKNKLMYIYAVSDSNLNEIKQIGMNKWTFAEPDGNVAISYSHAGVSSYIHIKGWIINTPYFVFKLTPYESFGEKVNVGSPDLLNITDPLKIKFSEKQEVNSTFRRDDLMAGSYPINVYAKDSLARENKKLIGSQRIVVPIYGNIEIVYTEDHRLHVKGTANTESIIVKIGNHEYKILSKDPLYTRRNFDDVRELPSNLVGSQTVSVYAVASSSKESKTFTTKQIYITP